MNDTEIILKAFDERKTTELCQVKGSKCVNMTKDGKCLALLNSGHRCTGLIGIVIDNVAGTIKDTWTKAEIPLEVWQMLACEKEQRPMKELANKPRKKK
jgi:hypothetical protein